MYKVLNMNTKDVIYTTTLLYVKKNPNSGAWIRVSAQDDAEAVAICGQLFNLPNKPQIEGFDTAVIRNLNSAEILQSVEHNTDQNSVDVNNLIGAVCDVGNDSDMLINAILELNERLEAIQNG